MRSRTHEKTSPLSVPVFRALWLAGLVGNIGSWMQTVGAQWLLVQQHSPSWIIGLVQAAASLPVLFLAIPAGVLGEFVNRRRLLIVLQCAQIATAGALYGLALANALDAGILLALTFVLGASAAIQLPAYQALIPEIVPRKAIPDAAALSSVGVNLARAVGPALAGVVVAQGGVSTVFLLNAASFTIFLAVLVGWRGYVFHPGHPERVASATRAGIRFVTHAPIIRGLCLRLAWFVIPGSALWALLPVVAAQGLGLAAAGYGVLLGALGVGATAGAFALPRLRRRLGTHRLTAVGAFVFAAATVAVAVPLPLPVLLPVLVLGGVGWIGGVATASATIQEYLPAWVRSRALSIYQLVLFGSMGAGSVLASALSAALGLTASLVVAAAVLASLGLLCLARPLATLRADQVLVTPLAQSDLDPLPRVADSDEEVVVLVTYTVPQASRDEFVRRMRAVETSRRRTGARRWRLTTDPEKPDTLVEVFVVGSWAEHRAQHEDRQTGLDHDARAAARELSSGEPVVAHLVTVDVDAHPVFRRHPGTPAS